MSALGITRDGIVRALAPSLEMQLERAEREIITAVTDLDGRHACRDRVLAAIEDILKFDTDPVMRRVARNRYLDLTEAAA